MSMQRAPRSTRISVVLFALALACALTVATGGQAGASATAVDLGTATSFAVLAGTTVTNTGPSIISGDLGVSPGTAVTGFPPGQVTNGTIHSADALAQSAQADATTAYNAAAAEPSSATITADLGGQALDPGVYTGTTLSLTGTLTLDAHGDPNAVFVFQSAQTLITASASAVSLVGGATACNVYWQIGSSATLGTNSVFVGTVLALASVTATTGAVVEGRLLASTAAVTLDSNTVTAPDCTTETGPTTTTTAPDTTAPASTTTSAPVTTTAPTTVPVTTLPTTTTGPVVTTTSPVTTPPTTVPPTTVPPTTLPVTTLPVTTLPPTTLPVTTLPVTTLPPTTLPVTTLPSTTLPVTTLPPTTLPPTTLPVTTLPVTTLPVTTLPVTTLPVTTLPGATTTVPVVTSTTPATIPGRPGVTPGTPTTTGLVITPPTLPGTPTTTGLTVTHGTVATSTTGPGMTQTSNETSGSTPTITTTHTSTGLARTGVDVGGLVLVGLAALLMGFLLTRAAKRLRA